MRDNPHLDERQIKMLEGLLPKHERAVRIEGRFAARGRLYYPDFEEALHLRACEPPLSEEQWANRMEVIDPGWAVPCAVHFNTIEPGNVLGTYDEIYERQRSVAEIAALIYLKRWTWRGLMTPSEIAEYTALALPAHAEEAPVAEKRARREEIGRVIRQWRAQKGDHPPRLTLCDVYGVQMDQAKDVNFIDQLREHGIYAKPASNADKDGQRRAVRTLMQPAGGLVRLWVAPRCAWTLWEVRRYREKDPPPGERDFEGDKERPRGRDDHAMNCWEYAVAAGLRHEPLGARPAPAGSPMARHRDLVESINPQRASLRRG